MGKMNQNLKISLQEMLDEKSKNNEEIEILKSKHEEQETEIKRLKNKIEKSVIDLKNLPEFEILQFKNSELEKDLKNEKKKIISMEEEKNQAEENWLRERRDYCDKILNLKKEIDDCNLEKMELQRKL